MHVKHAVSVPVDDRDTVRIADVMAPPVVVPSSLPLDPLMETLRAGGLQMAIVVDEFGGTDGLVTVEDLIEEIVGEVVDEHDRVNMVAQRSRDGSWLLSGLLRPSEARETTGVDVPDTGEYQTLGGLMGHVLGRIPRTGDVVDVAGVRYVVERMDGRRVDRIRIEPRRPAPSPRPAADDDGPRLHSRGAGPERASSGPAGRAGRAEARSDSEGDSDSEGGPSNGDGHSDGDGKPARSRSSVDSRRRTVDR
nr:transporter associated domain-containing protein [Micromonospora sp. DSM 115978]